MGDRHDGDAVEPLAQRALNDVVRLHVDGGRRLVQHEHARLAQQRTRHAHQLPLPGGQVAAALIERTREAVRVLLDGRAHRARAQHLPDMRVGVRVEGVHVVAQRPREEHRVLRDDGEGGAQRGERDRGDVDAVDEDGARAQLDETEEADQQRRLAGRRAAAHAHLLRGLDGEARPLQHIGQPRPVAHDHIAEDDAATLRPADGGSGELVE
eukprot:scaffold9399_cov36-Phaeocystis_antarctica.AAC.2